MPASITRHVKYPVQKPARKPKIEGKHAALNEIDEKLLTALSAGWRSVVALKQSVGKTSAGQTFIATRINRLRALGYQIEGKHGFGYRIEAQ